LSSTERPLRADARRNRTRLLEVADRVFTERGVGVPTEEVARAAGVGIGTLFRHFPTKEALLEAVLTVRLTRLADEAESLAAAADPGAALDGFLRLVVGHAAVKNAYGDALAAGGNDLSAIKAEVGGRLRAALAVLLQRAQAAAAVRPELTPPDLMALLVGASRAVEHTGDAAARDRVLGVVLAGLRPEDTRPEGAGRPGPGQPVG
jgi:AcrR family transcriptional regulator